MAQQWVPMKVAAKRLDVSATKISRWAKRGLLQTKENPYDKRSRLVDLTELQEKIAELTEMNYMGDDEEEAQEE